MAMEVQIKLNNENTVLLQRNIANTLILEKMREIYPYIIDLGIYLLTKQKDNLLDNGDFYTVRFTKKQFFDYTLSYSMNKWQKNYVWKELRAFAKIDKNDDSLIKPFVNTKGEAVMNIPIYCSLNFGKLSKLKPKNKDTLVNQIEEISIHFNKDFFNPEVCKSFFKYPREMFATTKTLCSIRPYNVTAHQVCWLVYYFNTIWNYNSKKKHTKPNIKLNANKYLFIAQSVFARETLRQGRIVSYNQLNIKINECLKVYHGIISLFDLKVDIDCIPLELKSNRIKISNDEQSHDISQTTGLIGTLFFLGAYFGVLKKDINDSVLKKNPEILKSFDKIFKSYTKKQKENLKLKIITWYEIKMDIENLTIEKNNITRNGNMLSEEMLNREKELENKFIIKQIEASNYLANLFTS